MPGNDVHGALSAYDATNDLWSWVPDACWDRHDASCRQVVINWTASSIDGAYYNWVTNDVHLQADDPNSRHAVLHEVAHVLMDDAYDDDAPPTPNCALHPIDRPTSTGCAWSEGFADWVPAAVYDDPSYRFPDGTVYNLESPTWSSRFWGDGDTVEGRVAGALIDLTDTANEAPWDRLGEGEPGNVWTTIQNHVSHTYAEFMTDRAADGFDVSNDRAIASLYQNTIDYTFREPLTDQTSLERSAPTPHNYKVSTAWPTWSVVGLRSASNVDMALFDDLNQSQSMGTSQLSGTTVDFIGVDSNHRTLDNVYPRAFSGGFYTVDLADSGQTISTGTYTIAMPDTAIVAVRDIALAPGPVTRFRVVPLGSGQNPELHLLGSNPADPTTWVRTRTQAVASATSSGVGVSELLSYAAPSADRYGLVLVNAAGSGSYRLYVDASAPTASILINGDAARTNTLTVTLDHPAVDPQTGVDRMRISLDGLFDTEPWVAYAPISKVTLPGGTGIKRVWFQAENPCGIRSVTISDTIDYRDP